MIPLLALILTATLAALFHALSLEHELPLAMLACANGWPFRRLMGFTLIVMVIHVSSSLLLYFAASLVGQALASYVARATYIAAGAILFSYGILYALLAKIRKEGHDPPVNLDKSAWAVALAGMAPCPILLPVIVVAALYGWIAVAATFLAFATTTIASTALLTAVAFKAMSKLMKLIKFKRRFNILTGIVISSIGLWLLMEALLLEAMA